MWESCVGAIPTLVKARPTQSDMAIHATGGVGERRMMNRSTPPPQLLADDGSSARVTMRWALPPATDAATAAGMPQAWRCVGLQAAWPGGAARQPVGSAQPMECSMCGGGGSAGVAGVRRLNDARGWRSRA